MAAVDKKDLWVNWTNDAVANFVMPDEVGDPSALASEMADLACEYADEMLEEFERRFESGAKGRRRRKNKNDEDDED